MRDYPEHDKLNAISSDSQAIGEFLESSGYALAEWDGNLLRPTTMTTVDILAEYFEIDQVALENEKRQMLDKMYSERMEALANE